MHVFAWVLLSLLQAQALLAQLPCPKALSKRLHQVQRLDNGSIISKDLIYGPDISWYVDGSYYGCPCKAKESVCVRKCCPEGKRLVYNESNEMPTCEDDSTFPYKPVEVMITNDDDEKILVNLSSNFSLLDGNSCNISSVMEPKKYPNSHMYTLMDDGSMFFDEFSNEFNPGHFCFDLEKSNLSNVIVVTCFNFISASEDNLKFVIYGICISISCLFLAITVMAYFLVPEMRNNHGSSVASYSVSLLVGYVPLAIIDFRGGYLVDSLCISLAFVTQFGVLSAFFWLNVMCLDMWGTFRGYRKATSTSRVSGKSYTLKCLYAWGVPFLIFLVTLLGQLAPGWANFLINPGFGVTSCWFNGDHAIFLYFYGPIAALVCLNVWFFITTAMTIFGLKREVRVLKHTDSKRHIHQSSENKMTFNIYFKLFLIMGINWVFEIASFLIPHENLKWLWYFTDIFNIFQGMFTFWICVWTTKIRGALLKRICPATALHHLGVSEIGSESATASSNASEATERSRQISLRPFTRKDSNISLG